MSVLFCEILPLVMGARPLATFHDTQARTSERVSLNVEMHKVPQVWNFRYLAKFSEFQWCEWRYAMTESRDEWIKKRAYSLWEEEGYPTGKDAAHWEQATKERSEMEKTAPDGLKVKPKAKSAAASKKSAANGAIPPAAVVKRTAKKAVSAKA